MKNLLLIALFGVGALAPEVHAQGGVPLWTNRYNGPPNGYDQANAVVVDANGNVFVTGSSSGVGYRSDYATIKYSGAGVPLWTNRYDGPGNNNDSAYAVAVDRNGDVVVTGGLYDVGSGGTDYVTIKYSAAGVPLWINRYNGPANDYDGANAVAVDGSGNVFVTGYSYGSASGRDYATIKYSGAGVPLWTNRYDGPANGDDYANAVAVDSNGDVFVTGYSRGSGDDNSDYVTIKYSGAGVPLWTNRYDGPANGDDRTYAVAVDGSGNVFVTGSSSGFGSGSDYATIKYSGAGVPLWTNHYNGPANSDDYPEAVAVDSSGNVFVTGSSSGVGSEDDYATIKYSGAGVPLWTNRYDGPANGYDGAHAVVVDGNGDVFVTGYSSDAYATIKYSGAGVPLWTNLYSGVALGDDQAHAMAVDGSGDVVVAGGSFGVASDDYATIKYSGAGVPLWTNRYEGPVAEGDDRARAIAVDGSGNVIVMGSSDFHSATIKYSSGGVPLWTNPYEAVTPAAMAVDGSGNVFVTGTPSGSGSSSDYATIKYSDAGVLLWTNLYNGPGNISDSARAIAVDGNGDVFVTGVSQNASLAGSADYVTIKYSGAGVLLWTNRYNGPGNGDDSARAIAVDGSGNVVVTGSSYGVGSGYDHATIKYSGAGVPLWTNRYNGPGNSDDAGNALAVDASGNVFVTGYSNGSGSSSDYATIKYSGAGVPLWTNRYNGPANGGDGASALVVDGNGNVVVTGSSSGSGSSSDYATIKYSGAGVPLWTNRYNGPANSDDYAGAVAVDGNGNVVVTGYSSGGGSGPDFTTIAYSSAGVPLWTNRYNGPANRYDGGTAVAVDGNGDVVVTGYSQGSSGSDVDFATIKYSGIPLTLTSQPQGQTIRAGSNVTFRVSAASSFPPISYQWQFNAAVLPRETNATLAINNAQLGDAGDYRVVVTDARQSLASDIARLTILTAPTITQQPQSQTVRATSNATFNVSVSDAVPPVHYQWQFNGSNLSGATNDSLTITNVGLSDAGDYQVVVTNIVASVSSIQASLSLLDAAAPTVTTLAASTIAATSATLRGTVNPNGAVTSAHFEYGPGTGYGNSTPAVNLGSRATSMAVSNVVSLMPTTTYHFRLVAGNSGGTSYGADQTFTTPLPSDQLVVITGQPQDQAVLAGASAVFSVSATSGFPLHYQWQLNATDIPDATNSTLTVTNVQTPNLGNYIVTVANMFTSATSAVATLQFRVPPTIVQQPQPMTVVIGENATFTVTVTNNATLPVNYQWRKGSVILTNILLNTTNCSFTLYNVQTNVTPTNGPGSYRVVVTNVASTGLGTASSLVALTVITATPPDVVTLAATNIAANGATVAGSINPNGATTLARFEYGFTTSYGNSTSFLNVGNGTNVMAVSRVVAGLVPATTYHFRLAASNSGGTNYGADMTFTTTPAVTPPTLVAPVRQGNQFSVSVTTVNGAVYDLERKTNLGDSNWTAVANLSGDGFVRVLSDPAATDAQGFYRVRVE